MTFHSTNHEPLHLLSLAQAHSSELSSNLEELSDLKRRLRLLEGLRDSHEEEMKAVKVHNLYQYMYMYISKENNTCNTHIHMYR